MLFLCVGKAERLPVKTYTFADGLQRNNVSKIRQDSRGFLWLCTAEGVSRFDGVGMTSFTVADGLPNRFVADVLETGAGTIYIATGKGLARLNPHGLRAQRENPLFTVFLPDNPGAERILTLFEDKNRQVWVGTSDGLYKLIEAGEQTRLEAVPLGRSATGAFYVNKIIGDRRGALWIGTRDGLLRLSPKGDVRRLTTDDGFTNNIVESLLEDGDGQIWVGFRNDGGLCLLDGEAGVVKRCYSQKDGLPFNWIFDVLQSSDGKIWVATGGGLCLWQGEGKDSVCKTYTEKNDLCEGVIALSEDREGNLWTGSSCGAKKIARYGFTAYYEADGLDWAKADSIFENSNGELFVSTNRNARAVSRFDGDKFSLVQLPVPAFVNYHGWGWQQTVWQDRSGAWWIPTGHGLFRSPDNTPFEDLKSAPLESVETGLKVEIADSQKQNLIQKYGAQTVSGMKFYEVFRLFEDSRGDIWIAVAFEKLLRWERTANRWHDYTAQAGLSPTRLISAFAEDRHGNVWIGTGSDDSQETNEGLLIRYRDGQFRRFARDEGSPSGWIRDLFLDSNGRLWVASTNDGVRRIDNTNADVLSFVSYTPADGLTSLSTASVTEDEFGRIYVGTWRGIDRLMPETGQIENLTTADGLPGSYVESAYRDRKNNLWFLTEKGVARFVPEPVRQRKPPTILITGLRVEGLPQNISILGETYVPRLDLQSDQRQISVAFLGLGASLGEKLKYEYRLGDADWTLTDERTLNFANLAPGDYQFEVRARTADRVYSSPAVVSFRIAAPLWQRWWFLLFTALALGGVIYLIYKSRLKRLLEIERTRTRIATDLHDDIGANLSKISLLSEIVKMQMNGGSTESRRMLTMIAEASRSSVDAMRDIVWAINPSRDSVLEMARKMRQHVEEVFVEKNARVKFTAPADGEGVKLSMDARRALFLIFKEAVNNAARHSACTEIEIDFHAAHGEIFLQVADNGRGFDAAAQNFDGNGLENMKTRAEEIGGRFAIKSEKGKGTVVQLQVNQNSLR